MRKSRHKPPRISSRHQLIERVRRELERDGYPRIQMLLLVICTGGIGFLASFVMLRAGVDSLAWRYGLAVGIAYAFFLLLLWLWMRTNSSDIDAVEVVGDVADGAADALGRKATEYPAGGGEFGGGGASGYWTHSTSEPLVEMPSLPTVPSLDVVDADEAAIPIVVLVCIAGVVFMVLTASLSIIYSAPVLFAELVVDGVLAASLYRRLRRIDSRHWLHSAIRRTIVPFVVTAMLLMAAGLVLSKYAPGARTLGEAVSVIRASS